MKTQNVAVIDANRSAVTLVNVYEVEPGQQTVLTERLAKATEDVMRQFPGFLSVSIHRSLDGTRVVNYAQWASKADLERMMKSPEAQAEIRGFASLARSVSPAVYEVTSVHVG